MNVDCTTHPRPCRQQALVVTGYTERGPFIEVYGPREMQVRVAHLPLVCTTAGEILAEMHIEATLPRCYRELYRADRLRAQSVIRPVLPSVMAEAGHYVQLLRGLDALEQSITAEPEVVLEWA